MSICYVRRSKAVQDRPGEEMFDPSLGKDGPNIMSGFINDELLGCQRILSGTIVHVSG